MEVGFASILRNCIPLRFLNIVCAFATCSLPTDIQAEGIPAILGGGDVLMAAETGSGKTGAFCLPIVQLVHEWLRDVASGKRGRTRQQVEVSNRWEINQYDRDDEIGKYKAEIAQACRLRNLLDFRPRSDRRRRFDLLEFSGQLAWGTCEQGSAFPRKVLLRSDGHRRTVSRGLERIRRETRSRY